ncbi:MAG: hypothetical protein R2751_20035 [Bacteroidales bacterium]
MIRKRLFALLGLPLLMLACEKDNVPFVEIKGIEGLIYQSIKAYRISNGEDGSFVHQYFMVGEAQTYSLKMAYGIEVVGTQGLDEHWDALNEKYNFYNPHALVLQTTSVDEDEILTQLLEIPGSDTTLLADVTQCGVGVESDSAGVHYVTILLAKADS